MIESIAFHGIPVLDGTTLSQLGQINVVCGRNNSGKSTLLRSISDRSLGSIGRFISPEDADHIASTTTEYEGWISEQLPLAAIAAATIRAADGKGVWYDREAGDFYEAVLEQLYEMEAVPHGTR